MAWIDNGSSCQVLFTPSGRDDDLFQHGRGGGRLPLRSDLAWRKQQRAR
jgi:hypothetical protein